MKPNQNIEEIAKLQERLEKGKQSLKKAEMKVQDLDAAIHAQIDAIQKVTRRRKSR